MGQKKLLGQILCEQNYITQEQLKQACVKQVEEYELIGQLLVSLGYITEEELKEALELQMNEMVKQE